MEETKQDLQLDIQDDVAEGKYSNLTIITHSSSEFILDFAKVLPGINKPRVQTRVIMSPENSKRLLYALQENLENYEKNYGEIKLIHKTPQKEEKETFVPPIGKFRGEA